MISFTIMFLFRVQGSIKEGIIHPTMRIRSLHISPTFHVAIENKSTTNDNGTYTYRRGKGRFFREGSPSKGAGVNSKW